MAGGGGAAGAWGAGGRLAAPEPPRMASSRILEASRMRVNSLGPEAPEGWADCWLKLAGGGAACTGGAAGGGVQAGAFGAGWAGSLGLEREAKVCVQAPGSGPRGGLIGV